MPDYSRITTRDASATFAFGEQLAFLLEPDDVVLLTGELGAGKTALAKGIAAGLGVAEQITSPTFNILLVHEGRIVLNHMDLYRIDRPEQLEDIDYWGTLESGGVSVVEWGDKFPGAIPEECLTVRIEVLDDEQRLFVLHPIGERGGRLAGAWLTAAAKLDGIDLAEDTL